MRDINATTRSPSKQRGASRLTESDILDHAYGVPSLLSRDTPSSSSTASRQLATPSRHGRSMSHPFPTLFQSKKKRNGDKATVGVDSTDEDQPSGKPSPASKTTRVSDLDLMTGRCMTCDSMVRWPKGLVVFRCTVCMTINDLKPRVRDQLRGAGKSSTGNIAIFPTGELKECY
jgi:E3 ubiquitin-protein ligase HECTD2